MDRKRVVLLLSVAIILAAAVFLAYELWISYTDTLKSARLRNESIAFLMASRVESKLNEIDFILQDILGDLTPALLSFRDGPNGAATREMNDYLLDKIRTHGWLFGLGVMNRAGVFVSAVNRGAPQNVGDNFAYRPYFSELAAHTNWNAYSSPAFQESLTGEVWFSLSRAVRLSPGRFDGVVFGGVSQKALQQEFSREPLLPGASIAIIDSRRGLIFRKPEVPGRVGQRVEGRFLSNFIESALTNQAVEERSPLDGLRRTVVLQKVMKYPYVIVASTRVDYDLEGWYRKLAVYAFAWVLIVLMVSVNHQSYIKAATQAGDLIEMNKTLITMQDELQQLATTDSLTGCYNRRRFLEIGTHEFNRAVRYQRPFSILMIDIDLFKDINDAFGHPAGDRVIRTLSDQVRSMLRTTDFLGRLGGEEFAVILTETGLLQASAIAERIRTVLSAARVTAPDGRSIHFTVSIGVAEYRPRLKDFDAILVESDQALYRAKQNGRDRVEAVQAAAVT